jgi:hypothetical protein
MLDGDAHAPWGNGERVQLQAAGTVALQTFLGALDLWQNLALGPVPLIATRIAAAAHSWENRTAAASHEREGAASHRDHFLRCSWIQSRRRRGGRKHLAMSLSTGWRTSAQFAAR